jgi:hypothetical protein
MKFCYGSGDPYGTSGLWLMDPDADPDPAIFVSDELLFEGTGTYNPFSKIKCHKEVTKL